MWFGTGQFYPYNLEPLFITRADVLPHDLVKSRSRESFSMILKFDRLLGSTAADVPVKFQNDTMISTPKLSASRLHVILRWDVHPLSKQMSWITSSLRPANQPKEYAWMNKINPNHLLGTVIYHNKSKQNKTMYIFIGNIVHRHIVPSHHQWPLLLTWFHFNPCMDK